ncbi:transposase [Actinomyces bouchesdurhonensis]|uniref:transposase n=1 Tax=Actinomyces bouchesdurhonensis TaxID=1852361 RepID=UPI0030B800C9
MPSRDSKNAIDDQLQDTTSVLDAFHIVKLSGDAPGEVRRRVQQDTTGHRARTSDSLSPGPQSFARLTPQAHPTPKGTPP